MFISVVLCILWMVFITLTIVRSKFPDTVINKISFLKIPILLLLFVFIARMWYVAIFDIQDLVNAIFGLFGCTPIELKNFG